MQILVVDDDENTLDFIKNAFEIAWPEASVITADSGQKGLQRAEDNKPDIILLDLGLPDMSGFDIVRCLRERFAVPIMMITVRGEERDIVKALSLGADEYLIKPFGQLELVARVKALIRMHRTGQTEVPVTFHSLTLMPGESELSANGASIHLTNIEKQICYQLLTAQGKTVTIRELARRIYGTNLSDGERGIKTHVYRLRRKFEKGLRLPGVILTKAGAGYYLLPDHI